MIFEDSDGVRDYVIHLASSNNAMIKKDCCHMLIDCQPINSLSLRFADTRDVEKTHV